MGELQRIVNQTADKVLELLGRTGAGQEVLAERAKKRLEEQKKLAEEWRHLKAQLDKGARGLALATSEAAKKIPEAQAALNAALKGHQEAWAAERRFVTGLDDAISRTEARLRDLASPRIAALRSELLDAWYMARAEDPMRFKASAQRAGKKVPVMLTSDRPSRIRQIEAIWAAREALRDLELEPLGAEALNEKLADVMLSIPLIEEESFLPPRGGAPEAA